LSTKGIQWYNVTTVGLRGGKRHDDQETEQARNSLALVIDRSILELLGIDEQTTLNISTDAGLGDRASQEKRRRKRLRMH